MPRPPNSDPEIQRYYDGEPARTAELEGRYRTLEEPILADLRRCGIQVEDLFSLKSALPAAAADVLLRHLQRLSSDTIPGLKGTHTRENLTLQDGIVRRLFCVEPGFDGRPLVEAFTNSWDESLRWIILVVIAEKKPSGIDEWVEELKKTPRGKTLLEFEPRRGRRP